MSKQPEALRLADEFEKPYWDDGTPHGHLMKAAAQLRLLHSVNVELLDALWVCMEHNRVHHGESHNTVIQAREAIAKATGETS